MGKAVFEEQATPDTPASNKVALYPKAGGEMYKVSDDGTEKLLTTMPGATAPTAYALIVGDGTGVKSLSAATNGQIPIGSTGADPSIAAITGTANEIDVTNGAGTITIGIVNPLIVGKGGIGAATLVDHGVLVGSGTDPITPLAVGTNGQVLVGSTGADPVFATITDGEGITTTLGAGTLQIDCEDASDSNKGISELANAAETAAGTDTGRTLTPAGLATIYAYDTIWIPATAMTPRTTNGAPAGTNEYATNDIMMSYLAFDSATEEFGDFDMPMPEGWDLSTIKAKFYWTGASGCSENDTVEWKMAGQAKSNDDAIDVAYGDAGEVISDAVLAGVDGDLHVSGATPAITVGGTPALGDLIHFTVSRNVAGTDDMTEDAWLFGVLIQYKRTNQVAAW